MAKDELKKNKKSKDKEKIKDKEKFKEKTNEKIKEKEKTKDKLKDKIKDKDKGKVKDKDKVKVKDKEVKEKDKVKNAGKVKDKVEAEAKDKVLSEEFDFLLSSSLEEYMEQIYILNLQDKRVRVTDIAKELGLSKPSVNRAINNLASMSYVEHNTYGDIALTSSGKEIAEHIYYKHKMLETFLVEVACVPVQRAKKEARDASHYLSKDTIKKISKCI